MKRASATQGRSASVSPSASASPSASELISKRIAELGDWRGETLGKMRRLIKEADPDVVEEWKWMGTPVWSHDGIICTGESYEKVVKLTFGKGASLVDPAGLFNSSLEGNARRAIDLHEGEAVDEAAFRELIRQAVALNGAGKSKPRSKPRSRSRSRSRSKSKSTPERKSAPASASAKKTTPTKKAKSGERKA